MITEFSRLTGVPVDDLLGQSRKTPLKDYRHVYWWLLSMLGYSDTKIAKLNGRTPATVLKGIDNVETLMQIGDSVITDIIEKVMPLIEEIKYMRSIMTKIKQVLELSLPRNIHENKQELAGAIEECDVCHGKGYLYSGGFMKKYESDLNKPDYSHCPICSGTGKIKVKVTVEWGCVGVKVELPKEEGATLGK